MLACGCIRLSDFIKDGCGQCKCELTQILYPTFANIYLDLIARGVSAVGKVDVTFQQKELHDIYILATSFYSNFADKLDNPNHEELRELSGVVTTHDLASSPLAEKFRYLVCIANTSYVCHCVCHQES